MQIFRRGNGARGVMRDHRRDFERNPAIGTVCTLVNRPEKIGRARNVFEGEVEEHLLGGAALAQTIADRGVIGRAVLDRMIENRRVRGKSRDRQLFDVFPESSTVEQVSGNVVEPQALAQIMQLLCCFHKSLLIGLPQEFVQDSAARLPEQAAVSGPAHAPMCW